MLAVSLRRFAPISDNGPSVISYAVHHVDKWLRDPKSRQCVFQRVGVDTVGKYSPQQSVPESLVVAGKHPP
eukprot:7376612-Heterocapsa_arctica.AAC.1